MKITETMQANVTILKLDGPLNASSSRDVSCVLQRAVRKQEGHVVIDLSGIEYMTSAGIYALTDAHKQAREGGCVLALCSPSEATMELIRMVQLEKVFSIYATDSDAVQAMKK